jgi:hypothetical protein
MREKRYKRQKGGQTTPVEEKEAWTGHRPEPSSVLSLKFIEKFDTSKNAPRG